MFFDRHNQKNSSEKEASGDITCTSCFGNNKSLRLRLQLSGTGSHRTSWRKQVLWDLLAQEGVLV